MYETEPIKATGTCVNRSGVLVAPIHKKITEARKRVGRGGKRGRHCGRGKGGQKSRTGSAKELTAAFEGGQMPLVRRIPRRGFTNVFKKEFTLVNLQDLETHYQAGDVVNEATLREKGLVKGKRATLIKILGNELFSLLFALY